MRGVKRLLREPARGFYLLAECDGVVAGQTMVTFEWSGWRDGNFWWIQSVYVAPAFRRRGVFKALFARVQHLARRAGNVCGLRLYMERGGDERARAASRALGLAPAPYEMLETDFVLGHPRDAFRKSARDFAASAGDGRGDHVHQQCPPRAHAADGGLGGGGRAARIEDAHANLA